MNVSSKNVSLCYKKECFIVTEIKIGKTECGKLCNDSE